MLTQYLSCVPFPPDSLFFYVFLLLWRVLGDGWVEESGRWHVPAPCTLQSLTHFPCLQSQATAIIQSPTNSHFFFMAFQLSAVGGFSSELFLKLLPWETGKVKQLTRRHLVNSLLGFTHSKTATSTNLFTLCTHARTHTSTRVQL